MRAADEQQERPKTASKGKKRHGKKWGKYTHFSPTKAAKEQVREEARKYPPDALYSLTEALQSGATVSLQWRDEQQAIRAQIRAEGDDPMASPALAAYHEDALVALLALIRAMKVECKDWDSERMSPSEAHDW